MYKKVEKNGEVLCEIGRVPKCWVKNRRDIVRYLMPTLYKSLTFGDAIAAFREYEELGLVEYTDKYIVIYHDAN